MGTQSRPPTCESTEERMLDCHLKWESAELAGKAASLSCQLVIVSGNNSKMRRRSE